MLLASVAGKVFYDANLNGVIDAGEAGVANWGVYADTNNNGAFDGSAATYNATGLPLAINDNSTTSSAITVSGNSSTVAGIEVSLNITHTYDADLDIYLLGPNGTQIELSTDNGGSGDNFAGTIFDDNAATLITAGVAPFTGRFRPQQSMATAFGGLPVNGTWTLKVADDAGGDVGSLTSWGITFRTGETSSTTASNGNYLLSNVPTGTYNVRLVPQGSYQYTTLSRSVTLATSTTALTGIDYGVRLPPAAISGTLFGDYDRDGTFDTGEPTLAARTVYLDANNNGQLDSGERSTASNGSGAYSFADVVPGTYYVRQVLPVGWKQTSPTLAIVGRPGNDVGATSNSPSFAPNQAYEQDEIILGLSSAKAFNKILANASNRDLAQALDISAAGTLGTIDGTNYTLVPVRPGYDAGKLQARLADLSGVRFATLNYIYKGATAKEYTPNDPSFVQQYHHTTMGNAAAWNTSEGAGVIVAITDDGMMTAHPDLAPNLYVNPDEVANNGIDDDSNGYIDDVNGWDFTNSTTLGTGDKDPNPAIATDSHGTHVAGIVAARTNNGVGVAGTAGKSTIMPLRFYGTGNWTSTVIFNSYKYATDNGAKIVTTSYNVDGFVGDTLFASALDYMYDRGVLHFNSAGNNGQANPARQLYEQSLYVAATEQADNKASYSNWGTGIDVSAPGSNIYSTYIGSTLTTPSYASLSGTSMATPNAAASAALVWGAHPTWTREQVVAQLLGTATNIDTLAANTAYAGLLGAGRVNNALGVGAQIGAPKLRGLDGLPADGATVITSPTSFTLKFFNTLDPATANNANNFKFTSSGLDGVFGTGDDVNVPITRTSTTPYRIGTNQWTWTIGQALPEGSYRFTAAAGLTDPFGQALDGNGDGVGGDAFTRTFNVVGITAAHSATLGSGAVASLSFGSRETTAPTISTSRFLFDTQQVLETDFSEAVAAFNGDSFVLQNMDNGNVVPASQYSLARVNGNQTARLTLNTVLPNGNYRLYAAEAQIFDLYGNNLDINGDGFPNGSYSYAFSWLQGDMNRDGTLNNADIAPFVQGLTDPAGFQSAFGYAPTLLGDVNASGAFNNADISAFVALLTGGRPASVLGNPSVSASPVATSRGSVGFTPSADVFSVAPIASGRESRSIELVQI